MRNKRNVGIFSQRSTNRIGRKGNATLDGMVILIIIVVFAIASIFGLKVFNEINTDIQNDTDMFNESQQISADLYAKYPNLLDNLFLFAFVLLIIFTIVSVFMIDSHPIFFIITVLLLMGLFLTAILLGNVFDDIMSDDVISAQANQFTYTAWVMGHIAELMIAVGFIIAIALFIKFKGIG